MEEKNQISKDVIDTIELEKSIKNDLITIDLVNVSFRYPKSEKNVLENFNLTIKSGEKMALVEIGRASCRERV